MISAKTIRGTTTYSIEGHPDRGGMLTEAVLRRPVMYGARVGYETIHLDFMPHRSSPLSLACWDPTPITGWDVDRFEESWDRGVRRCHHTLAAYERFEARRAELLALARDLEAARDLLTNADLGPWVERFADIMEGVQP